VLPVIFVGADGVSPATSGGSGSHLVASLAQAEALAIIPAHVERISEGDDVTVMVLS
jgi:molybdopterin molybdotransferase